MWWVELLNSFVSVLDSGGAGGGGGSYESIATLTPTSGTLFTFSSIPQTYASLQIRIIGRNGSASTGVSTCDAYLNANGASGLFTRHTLSGNGSTVTATGTTPADTFNSILISRNNNTAGIYGATIIDIHDYASTTKNKTVRTFSGCDLNGSGQINLGSSLYVSTSAVTEISFNMSLSTEYKTTFALYGIK
jgi:hypothetical protein